MSFSDKARARCVEMITIFFKRFIFIVDRAILLARCSQLHVPGSDYSVNHTRQLSEIHDILTGKTLVKPRIYPPRQIHTRKLTQIQLVTIQQPDRPLSKDSRIGMDLVPERSIYMDFPDFPVSIDIVRHSGSLRPTTEMEDPSILDIGI